MLRNGKKTQPEVVAEVHSDGSVDFCDGHGSAEVIGNLKETERGGGGGEDLSGREQVVLQQPGAQIGREVNGSKQAAVETAAHGWGSELRWQAGSDETRLLFQPD